MDICPSVLYDCLKRDIGRFAHLAGFDPFEGPSLAEYYTPREIAARTILRTFLSKYKPTAKAEIERAEDAALELFLASNQKCKEWRLPTDLSEVDTIILGEFRDEFAKLFETPGGGLIDFPTESACFMRPGPGSSVLASGNDFISKISEGPLSTTSVELYWHYFNECLPFGLELECEITRSANFDTPVVRGSKLGFAPKKREIARTICTEPSLNMLFQLGTGAVLERILKNSFSIDLSNQPEVNRQLARVGSITGKYATSDQASASDSTSRGLWSWIMPYDEIRVWFDFIRSPYTIIPARGRREERVQTLYMMSSMGNGFTFPLMTLIFATVLKAVYKVMGIPWVRNRTLADGRVVPGNWGVFGDDIIVETRAFETLTRILGYLGYETNADKSFHLGSFRESCGGDYFGGHQVRGVYCKTLATPQHRYALINLLNAWSSNWNIPLPETIGALLKTVWPMPVPPYEGASSGVITPFSLLKDLRIAKPPEGRGSEKKPYFQGSVMYARFQPDPVQWEPVLSVEGPPLRPNGSDRRKTVLNASGLLLGAVRGYLRDGVVTVRDDNIRYKKRIAVCPGWAYDGTSQVGFTPEGWAVYEKYMARINLG